MLTEQEKNALLHFLSILNDHRIKNLANSITQGRITNKSREDAISCLFLHGESLISIMNNKRVSAACLLNYLHHLKAPSPGNANKETLLQYVYSIWKFPFPNTPQNNVTGVPAIPNNFNQFNPSNLQPQPAASTANNFDQFNSSNLQPQPAASIPNNFNQFNSSNLQPQPAASISNNFNQFNSSNLQAQPATSMPNNFNPYNSTNLQPQPTASIPNNFNQFNTQNMQQSAPSLPNNYNQFSSQNTQPAPSLQFADSGQAPPLQYPGQNMMNQQYPSTIPSNSLQLYDPSPKPTTSPYSQAIASYQLLNEVNSLAFDEFMVGFAKMFYELLNSAAGEYLHGLNRSHFFEECKTMIMIKGGEEDIEQVGESVIDALKLLSDLKREHQLTFNPNLTPEGVRGKTDSHGLIYAVASGTLHHGRGQLVGVFEQSFILRKDPFEQNSCKIADSTLILRSSNSVNSFSQLLLPASKKSNERNLAIDSAPYQLQITNK